MRQGEMGTEMLDPRFETLDRWPVSAVLDGLLEAQLAAVAAVRAALPQMEAAIQAALPRLIAGGRIAYAGAGTSGRVAFQDGAELPPTFDWPAERLVFLMAGGERALSQAVENAEDDRDAATQAVAAARLGPDDILLALAASGATPYTLAATEAARERGCLTVGIANNRGAPLLAAAEFGILAETGAETVAGSTRLKAGTAQKVVLNLLSTTLMIRLGRVHAGLMVDMRATNAKLRRRAMRMLRTLTEASDERIAAALAEADGKVKLATLLLQGMGRADAEAALAAAGGHLRPVLAGRP